MAIDAGTQASAKAAEALAQDFRNVVADAEELLAALGSDGDAKIKEMKGRVQESLNQARGRLNEFQASAVGGAKAAASATDEYVHQNPWQAVGVSAVIGGLLGYLIGRR